MEAAETAPALNMGLCWPVGFCRPRCPGPQEATAAADGSSAVGHMGVPASRSEPGGSFGSRNGEWTHFTPPCDGICSARGRRWQSQRCLRAAVPGRVRIHPCLSPPVLAVDCYYSCLRGLATRVGCCPVPSVPFPRTATQEKPHGRFPFPPSPLPGGPGWEGGSCTMDWEPAAPPLTPKRALSGPRAPTLPPKVLPSLSRTMAPCHRLPLHCHSLIPRDPPSPSRLLHPGSPPPRLVLLPQLLRDPSAGLAGTCGSGCGCSAGMAPCFLSPLPIPRMGSVGL